MDDILDLVTNTYRLILVVSLALLLLIVSAHRANEAIPQAAAELGVLQNAIDAADEQVNNTYKEIYERSTLKRATIAWLNDHHIASNHLSIELPLGDFGVPAEDEDPLVTLDFQLKWVNKIYLTIDFPYYLCSANEASVSHELSRLFHSTHLVDVNQLTVYLRGNPTIEPSSIRCKVEISYRVKDEEMPGYQTAILDLETKVISVDTYLAFGNVDADVSGILKSNGLGDWEDSKSAVLPDLLRFWKDVESMSPGAAEAFIDDKKDQDLEKAKRKIEILGEPLSGSLTISMMSAIILSLSLYFLALLKRVSLQQPEQNSIIADSVFFAVMISRLGRILVGLSLFAPALVVAYSLLFVFPQFTIDWTGPAWIEGPVSRYVQSATHAGVALLLVFQVLSIQKQASLSVNALLPLNDKPKPSEQQTQ